MIKKHFTDVKEEIITKANSSKTTIRWLITKDDGSQRFSSRRFEIKPGGQVGVHKHPEDHHVYVLSGTALFTNGKDTKFEAHVGDVIYIPPNEPHGIITVGSETFAFICIIPYL
jgi:quercetin dioxygenase-like cupin family protein